ncbi:MAG: H4MPT-linked C1 transfer pathway protein [Methylomonas sp.]|jgi:probable H4MPT-linked C1 transfer pathway protein|uniref:hydantoinase/oxoprolinase family protein n=1 Tax=Methylomonas sp. TaxID=418 RepID=UPI0025DC4979|nr:hydantoinase/oxoprolinase family protein [Methylomonas sp.]MCK9607256.1 H4MPT-linked C1 transfer pathway protein [Methylomonas sp.]
MQKNIMGWDIGGAHVKAALLNEAGEVLQVVQRSCPLWKGLAHLEHAIQAVLQVLQGPCDRHAVTMTGELADCFSGREQGVAAIIQTLRAQLGTANLLIFAGSKGFIGAEAVNQSDYLAIASANWIASAQLAAKYRERALFVDIGSTTADILLIEQHTLQAVGYSDYDRLVSAELVYTGIVRTAVMAVAQQAEFNGQSMGLMAEYFATMADVYRVTGDLNEAHDQNDSADGAEKTALASARRLSRMTGYEFTETDWPLWRAFAKTLKQQQKHKLRQACLRQMHRKASAEELGFIGAGVGRFLVKEIADELGLAYLDFSRLLSSSVAVGEIDAADCAPAVAVAYLAREVG